MKDNTRRIRDLNIWKEEPDNREIDRAAFYDRDIEELNLSVRAYNGLKRAGVNTIGEAIRLDGEDGEGLFRLRNVGKTSVKEIHEKITGYKELLKEEKRYVPVRTKKTIIKPAKRMWDMEIEAFPLSEYALTRLKACGIHQVKDLYATNPKAEPGWYAVRELFAKIPC